MARHFTDQVELSQQTLFFIVRKLFKDAEEFYATKKQRGVSSLDVREQAVQLKWASASSRFECSTGGSACGTATKDLNMEGSYVVPVGMFSLHGTRFVSFAEYASFFDAFPSVNVFKAAFLTCITLPSLPTVSDYIVQMSRENENAHLLTRIAELQLGGEPVSKEPVQ